MRILYSFISGLALSLAILLIAATMNQKRDHDLPELISPINLANYQPEEEQIREVKVKPKEIKTVPKRPKEMQQPRTVQSPPITMQPLSLELAPTMAANMAIAPTPEVVSKVATVSIYDLSAVDTPPKLKKYMPPIYPPKAKGQGVEGSVTVRVVVSAGGNVQEAKIIEATPAGYFEKAALKTVKKWTFYPAQFQGKKVPVYVDIPLSFSLD